MNFFSGPANTSRLGRTKIIGGFTMKHSLLRLLALISLLIASSVLSFAQVSSTAPLSGTVSDPNGAVIAGATVSVKNPSTGQEFSATTGDNGSFTIPAV